ncbi:DUF6062 family protein [Paenibacillus sp.]|uniref:DUF6062 family protein n=1 Tax=Paenibacillus sp. TaxID=58172 RepID=UPI002812352C|nr:DUF6062 family protein [Paenibacillus sp.]
MDKYILYHDLADALQHDQCPVCKLVDERVERMIKVLLREGAGDGQLIGSYVRARGYCNAHAWRVKESGDPASQAVFYRALLEDHKTSLEKYLTSRKQRDFRKKSNALRSLLQARMTGKADGDETSAYLSSFASEERCPICATTESCERRYVDAVVDYFEGDEEFRERYRNRGVLCHPHFRRLIQSHAERPSVPELLEIQLSRLDLQIEHLREIERKANVRFSDEEGDAYLGGWIRAVRLDVGLPGTDTRYKQRAAAFKDAALKP